MKSALHLACLGGLALALAACNGDKKSGQQGTAAGEILPASTSDAMLPYDTVRSQPPLAPLPAESGMPRSQKGGDDEPSADGSEATAEESPAPAAPVATPEPAAR